MSNMFHDAHHIIEQLQALTLKQAVSEDSGLFLSFYMEEDAPTLEVMVEPMGWTPGSVRVKFSHRDEDGLRNLDTFNVEGGLGPILKCIADYL